MIVEKEHILSEIRRLAEQNDGRALGRARFFAETGIRESDWLGRYWARWSDAVREAGLEPNTLRRRSNEDEALRLLALETRRLGHLPTFAELRLARRNNTSFPSVGVYERLGPKGVLAARVAAFCRENADYADVLEIVTPLLEAAEADGTDGDPGQPSDGFVYLLKSGRHYKLGRTKGLAR